MLSLKEFLQNIKADKALKYLEKNPDTLNIKDTDLLTNQITHLINILKSDKVIKKLVYNLSFMNEQNIVPLAGFLKDQTCPVVSVGFVNHNLLRFGQKELNVISKEVSEIFKINIFFKEIILCDIHLGDDKLSTLIDGFNKNLSLESLKIICVNIKLETKEIIDKFNNYISNSNLKELNISRNPITSENIVKILEVIKEKSTISILDIGCMFLNDSSIDAICSSFGTRISEFIFSLNPITDASKEKLLVSIKNNKTLINCKIWGYRESSLSVDEKDVLQEKINQITNKNKKILEEVIQFLKDFYEIPEILHKSTVHNHLKLYKKLNLDYLKVKLEELNTVNIEPIIQNAEKYTNEYFFDMVGVAKQADFGKLPKELIGHIASYLDFSDIL